MTEIKLTRRYPQSRTEDIVDAYMRGWNDALDAVQNGKFHIAEQTKPNSSEKPNNCETCKHQGNYDYCRDCYDFGLYETDEPQTDVYEYHNGEWVKPDCPWK